MRYKFWRHNRDGEIWAVELEADGTVCRTCGPLHHRERDTVALEDFEYDAEDAEWMQEHESEFALWER